MNATNRAISRTCSAILHLKNSYTISVTLLLLSFPVTRALTLNNFIVTSVVTIVTISLCRVYGPGIFGNVRNCQSPSRGGDADRSDHYETYSKTLDPHPSNLPPTEPLRLSNGTWLTESQTHKVHFRGINIPAKTPSSPPQLKSTVNSYQLYGSKRVVSFVGRPFSLGSAPSHFHRLRLYGFNLVRLTVTWEAVMHSGPGIVDGEYLEYLSKLVDIANEFGIYVILDPHQDVWSRFTGGDGAPWWTLDAVGFVTDSSRLHDTGCAVLHQHFLGTLPDMMWPTNYARLACATMFTLFFAGDVYAPGLCVEGTDVTFQSYLQGYYMEYLEAVTGVMKGKVNVLGFGSMNEPSHGLVGMEDLRKYAFPAPLGHVLTFWDGMRLGSGESLQVDYYGSPFCHTRTEILNPQRQSAWKSHKHDVWNNAGVYKTDPATLERVLLRPHHFHLPDKNISFVTQFMKPFFIRVSDAVNVHHHANDDKSFVVYAEPNVDPLDPKTQAAPKGLHPDKFGWAPHWYDVSSLFFKRFYSWFAIDIDRNLPMFFSSIIHAGFARSLTLLRRSAHEDDLHVILGETGVPFDLKNKTDYDAAQDRTLRAVEAVVPNLDCVLWCYCPDSNDTQGDLWNGEELSIRQFDGEPNDDGVGCKGKNRGLNSVVRPIVRKLDVRMNVTKQYFDRGDTTYLLFLQSKVNLVEDHGTMVMAEVYLPSYHFDCPKFEVSSGVVEHDAANQCLTWKYPKCAPNGAGGVYTLRVTNTAFFSAYSGKVKQSSSL